MVADSAAEFGDQFPGMKPVAMITLVDHYLGCVDGHQTGTIIRAYG